MSALGLPVPGMPQFVHCDGCEQKYFLRPNPSGGGPWIFGYPEPDTHVASCVKCAAEKGDCVHCRAKGSLSLCTDEHKILFRCADGESSRTAYECAKCGALSTAP